MNIYELAIEKYKSFTGEKLIVWENAEKKHKVWMEANQQFQVHVYVMRDGKTLKPRWKIGYLGRKSYNNLKFSYNLINETILKKSYQEWSTQCKS